VQNEPLHSSDSAWTMHMDAPTQSLLARSLSAAISASQPPSSESPPPTTQLWAYDHNTDVPEYPASVLAAAPGCMAAVAWHCYAADATGWGVLSDFQRQHAGVMQIMTECWTHVNDSAFFDLPDFVHGPMQNWAGGALAWTLAGSAQFDVSYPGGCAACSGLVQVDNRSRTYEFTRDFYALGQFSRFVARGSVALNGSVNVGGGGGGGSPPSSLPLETSQFIDPFGNRIVVLSHKSFTDSLVQLDFASGDSWWGQLHARSLTTWLLPPAAS
jgi:glucosylceramidase